MHKWTYLHHNATDMRTLLMNLLYQKSLRLAISQESFGDGEATNIMYARHGLSNPFCCADSCAVYGDCRLVLTAQESIAVRSNDVEKFCDSILTLHYMCKLP